MGRRVMLFACCVFFIVPLAGQARSSAARARLVRRAGDYRIFVMQADGSLNQLPDPQTARQMFGPAWPRLVAVLSVRAFSRHLIRQPIKSIRPAPQPLRMSPTDGWLTAEQKRRAEQLTSLFENGTTTFDYAAVENIQDGRGYTAGRIGFTTATGDALEVVARYARIEPENPLALYLPRLRELSAATDGSTAGLQGFPEAWRASAQDPAFRQIQDQVTDEEYYIPAMQAADAVGLRSALARAIIYDSMIQHGGGEQSPDGVPALIARTTARAGGTPKTGVSEPSWVTTFLRVRKDDLLHASDLATRDAWAASAGRVDVLRDLWNAGHFDLHGPIIIPSGDYQGVVY